MGRIVVGIDGSPGSREALRFALEEARLRGSSITAVFAWSLPLAVDAPGGLMPELVADFQAEATEELQAVVAEAGDLAGAPVEQVVVEGAPAKRLLEAAKDAELLVVGSRGRGGFTGLLLGSVSQQCAHHAPCPVVIVPTPK
jgi:nucleotide-binding universal stress UspA family protein